MSAAYENMAGTSGNLSAGSAIRTPAFFNGFLVRAVVFYFNSGIFDN